MWVIALSGMRSPGPWQDLFMHDNFDPTASASFEFKNLDAASRPEAVAHPVHVDVPHDEFGDVVSDSSLGDGGRLGSLSSHAEAALDNADATNTSKTRVRFGISPIKMVCCLS